VTDRPHRAQDHEQEGSGEQGKHRSHPRHELVTLDHVLRTRVATGPHTTATTNT
jgi:hypothetical protein